MKRDLKFDLEGQVGKANVNKIARTKYIIYCNM